MARKSYARVAVLAALLDEPTGNHYGLEIAKAAGLATGTIYPILARLEADGVVTSEWEDIDESHEGRRRRRYYQLTGEGISVAQAEVGQARRALGTPALRPGVAGAWA